MNEKLIERKLRETVKQLGGIALKFSSPYHRGMPDRIILMPEGRIAFAELKTTGKKPTELQKKALTELRSLGFKADVIDSQESLNNFLEEIK
ncbi:VRR-NUC domain-containing protein [uncultured Bacteroides sp.]|mgnify:CR=1 FL=1|uniref:VRR-NUC domain-containing protein n=1 Tax=uncultured Bacteroides sp. TaxID=162156 RepID=UPI00205A78D2|nr:VRR-NUC domain-containing protein [uncultured Bacteroides sp.]DAJ86858.1 MAG TPA: Nuclease [Caudoviricetes sp.]